MHGSFHMDESCFWKLNLFCNGVCSLIKCKISLPAREGRYIRFPEGEPCLKIPELIPSAKNLEIS